MGKLSLKLQLSRVFLDACVGEEKLRRELRERRVYGYQGSIHYRIVPLHGQCWSPFPKPWMDGHSVVCGDIEQFQEVVAPTGPLHERGSNSNEVVSDGRRTFERRQTIPKYVWHRRDLTGRIGQRKYLYLCIRSMGGRSTGRGPVATA